MSKGGQIWLEGERELYVNMQRRMDGSIAAAQKGLQRAGLNIIADAKNNLRANGSVVTGQLRASGRVQKVAGDENAIDVGFFSQDTQGGYAFFVEYGRKAGKFPPVDYITQWVRKKLRVIDEKLAKGIGFVIARKIAKSGTRPHPFFRPAVEKKKKAVSDAIAEAVKGETNKDGK